MNFQNATHPHANVANGGATKTPSSPVPGKTHSSQPGSDQPFVNAVGQLVDNGVITATQGRAVDSQIQQGYFDSSTLTGFTQTQIRAIVQALSNAKRALA